MLLSQLSSLLFSQTCWHPVYFDFLATFHRFQQPHRCESTNRVSARFYLCYVVEIKSFANYWCPHIIAIFMRISNILLFKWSSFLFFQKKISTTPLWFLWTSYYKLIIKIIGKFIFWKTFLIWNVWFSLITRTT